MAGSCDIGYTAEQNKFILLPLSFSLFIRDSTNCVLVTACQQFRTRDCRDLRVYLACPSQPIIESSHNIRLGCLTLNYEQLAGSIDTIDTDVDHLFIFS